MKGRSVLFGALLAASTSLHAIGGVAEKESLQLLGSQLTYEIRREARPIDDPVLLQYVKRIVRAVLGDSSPDHINSITLIDSNDVEGAKLPGSYFVLSLAAIRRAGDEAELESTIDRILNAGDRARRPSEAKLTERLALDGREFARLKALANALHGQIEIPSSLP
jgi:predicted Zn-dependent protease